MKRILLFLWALVLTVAVDAQMADPVHFTSELKTGKGAEAEIIFHATIDRGWHVYSTDIGENGPIEATFNIVKMDGAERVGKLTPKGNVIKKMDKMFNMELKYFENEATFVQKIRFTKPDYDIDCYLEYGVCSDEKGQQKTLRTVGAKWSYLQSHKFGANAQPFYVALDPTTGKPLTGSYAFNEDISAYLEFLNQGLKNYKK